MIINRKPPPLSMSYNHQSPGVIQAPQAPQAPFNPNAPEITRNITSPGSSSQRYRNWQEEIRANPAKFGLRPTAGMGMDSSRLGGGLRGAMKAQVMNNLRNNPRAAEKAQVMNNLMNNPRTVQGE